MRFLEHYRRSLAKTFTYRLLIIISNSLIIYNITGRVDITAGFTLLSTMASTILYFIHERVWNQIHWGKEGKKG